MYFRKTYPLMTEKSKEGVDIKPLVLNAVAESGVCNGLATIEIGHSTAGIMTTTDHCPEVQQDIAAELDRLVPARVNFIHQETPEDASGHIKCALFGNAVTLIVEDGTLLSKDKLGIFLMEYDGPRHRKVNVAVLGEAAKEAAR